MNDTLLRQGIDKALKVSAGDKIEELFDKHTIQRFSYDDCFWESKGSLIFHNHRQINACLDEKILAGLTDRLSNYFTYRDRVPYNDEE